MLAKPYYLFIHVHNICVNFCYIVFHHWREYGRGLSMMEFFSLPRKIFLRLSFSCILVTLRVAQHILLPRWMWGLLINSSCRSPLNRNTRSTHLNLNLICTSYMIHVSTLIYANLRRISDPGCYEFGLICMLQLYMYFCVYHFWKMEKK